MSGRVQTLVRRAAARSADAVVRATLRVPALRRRRLEPRLLAYVARRAPDDREVADETIARLKSLTPIDVPALVANYIAGLLPFGMYYRPDEYYWSAPHHRGLITVETARLSRSVRRQVGRSELEVRFDSDVETIVRRCRRADGTWLHEPIIEAVLRAAELGLGTTIGAYRDGALVAGEFGLLLGGWYASMSTFHDEDGAGNVVFARVVQEIIDGGRFVACDVGEMKDHARQFGAVVVTEDDFRRRLVAHLGQLRYRR